MFSSQDTLMAWQPVETAPHETNILLGYWKDWPKREWVTEVGWYSRGQRFKNGHSNYSRHGYATHWMPLPDPPQKG